MDSKCEKDQDLCIYDIKKYKTILRKEINKFRSFMETNKKKFEHIMFVFYHNVGITVCEKLENLSSDDLGFLLICSIRASRYDLVKLFINKGADLNYSLTNKLDCVNSALTDLPIHQCILSGNSYMYEFLLKQGLKLNINNTSLFRQACIYGNLKIVKDLVSRGFLPYGTHENMKCKYGSVLQSICECNFDIARYLMQQIYVSESIFMGLFRYIHEQVVKAPENKKMIAAGEFILTRHKYPSLFLKISLEGADDGYLFWKEKIFNFEGRCGFMYSHGPKKGTYCKIKVSSWKYCRKHLE